MASLTYRRCRFIRTDFTIISLPDSAMEPPELTGINDYAIDLIESKQTLYDPIYSLGPVELETLKTYIKIWPMDLAGLPSHRKPMLIAFEPMLSAHNWQTIGLPGSYQTLCFIQLDCIDAYHGKKTREGNNWRQHSGPVTVARVSDHSLPYVRPPFRAMLIRPLPRSSIYC